MCFPKCEGHAAGLFTKYDHLSEVLSIADCVPAQYRSCFLCAMFHITGLKGQERVPRLDGDVRHTSAETERERETTMKYIVKLNYNNV